MGLEAVLAALAGSCGHGGCRGRRWRSPGPGRPGGRCATARRCHRSPRPARRPGRPPAPATPPPRPASRSSPSPSGWRASSPASTASASLTSAETSSSRAAGSSQAISGLPGRGVVMPAGAGRAWRRCSAAPGTSRATRRIAAISWVTVSWRATASSRIVESSARRVLPGTAPVSATTSATTSKIALRAARGGQPAPPVGQRRRVERGVGDRQPARGLPPQIERQRLDRLPVRQPVQGLQHQHRGHHLRRHTRAAPAGREQVGEQLRREQPAPVLGQEREHAARLQQMPRDRLHIQQLTLIIRATLHPTRIPARAPTARSDTPLCSAVS